MTVTINKRETEREMQKQNPENFNVYFNGTKMRAPDGRVYIHSVAKRSFVLRKPPLLPMVHLKGCENGERSVLCAVIPDPILQSCPDLERGGSRIDEHPAWDSVINMLSPANFSPDPFLGSDNPDFYSNARGMNLVCEGVFPSIHETPSLAELTRAEACRDRRYRWLTREATRLAAVSTRELNDFLQQNPDTHLAMDALGLEASWHARNEVRAMCPNCGETIRPGLAFHKIGDAVCVIDPLRALKAGIISKERYYEMTAPEQQDEPQPEDVTAAARRPRRGQQASEE